MKKLIIVIMIAIVPSILLSQALTTNPPDKSNEAHGTRKVQPNEENNKRNNTEDEQASTININDETTSAGGSPGVPSAQNGNAPDGTNTVQRASLNIAGSPIPGVGDAAQKNIRKANDNKKDDPRENQSEDLEGKNKNRVKASTEHVKKDKRKDNRKKKN